MLDEEAKRRLHTNPLRILDTKNPAMQRCGRAAPRLLDFLGEASLAHFNAVKAILDANGVAYSINPRLVRGMDYYNLTVFEFITTRLGSQGTICGGGRYDYLIEQVGGKPAPAVGWALGVERVLELIKEQGEPLPDLAPDVYAIVPDASSLPVAIQLLQTLRALGVSAQMHAGAGEGMGSMKSQFKKADASGAFALVFGAEELAQGQVACQIALRDGEGAQRTESLSTALPNGPTAYNPRFDATNLQINTTMAKALDLEEQEQLDQIKHFWNAMGQPDFLAADSRRSWAVTPLGTATNIGSARKPPKRHLFLTKLNALFLRAISPVWSAVLADMKDKFGGTQFAQPSCLAGSQIVASPRQTRGGSPDAFGLGGERRVRQRLPGYCPFALVGHAFGRQIV